MRFPTQIGLRPPTEHGVDRPEVYSSNAQPTGTNRPRAYSHTLNKTNKHPHTPGPPARARGSVFASTPTPHNNAQQHSGFHHHTPARTRQPQPARETSQERVGEWTRVTAAIAKGKHPVPSRTRKLSLSAPMVLHPRECGRVGRRRTYFVVGVTFGWPLRSFQGHSCCPTGT